LQELLHKRLADIEKRDAKESKDGSLRTDASAPGRLGPKVVKMDREGACGLCQFTFGDLEVRLCPVATDRATSRLTLLVLA
jgi:hypothetical protein